MRIIKRKSLCDNVFHNVLCLERSEGNGYKNEEIRRQITYGRQRNLRIGPCPVLRYSGIFYELRLIPTVSVLRDCNIHLSIAGVHGLFGMSVAAVVSVLVAVIVP